MAWGGNWVRTCGRSPLDKYEHIITVIVASVRKRWLRGKPDTLIPGLTWLLRTAIAGGRNSDSDLGTGRLLSLRLLRVSVMLRLGR